jgi:hypothetical protein
MKLVPIKTLEVGDKFYFNEPDCDVCCACECDNCFRTVVAKGQTNIKFSNRYGLDSCDLDKLVYKLKS